MSYFDILLTALGLSMDAFAAALCRGLAAKGARVRTGLVCGAYFGAFQMLMPMLGYLLAHGFSGAIAAYDHWIAFALLSVIGVNMLRSDNGGADAGISARSMLPLAVATSIDALAVGVSFAFLDVHILPAALMIGAVTFVLSLLGVCLGSLAVGRLKALSGKLGGVILIGLGVKILLTHLLPDIR